MVASSAYDIARVLIEAGAVLIRPYQPFTFASGLRSPIYCDNRILLGNHVDGLDVGWWTLNGERYNVRR